MRAARAAAPVVPHFEVAADVTMRFALEQPKHEPPPAPSSPPPRPEAPRPVPVPKQSSPTLLGQGPPARPEPAADAPGLPRDSVTIREGSSNPFAPPVLDDPEDAVTIARPNSAPPASAMQPAVKTARGLFAEPLLAEARAKLEAGGQSFVDKPLSAGPSPTPRMPGTLAEQAGAAGAGEHAAEAADRGAAIVDSVPVAGAPARGPRTLISSTGMAGVGEVSTGGFTPGSMTLSAQAALNHDALDPTVIHSVPKRGYGKYIVVVAAFLVVFGTGPRPSMSWPASAFRSRWRAWISSPCPAQPRCQLYPGRRFFAAHPAVFRDSRHPWHLQGWLVGWFAAGQSGGQLGA